MTWWRDIGLAALLTWALLALPPPLLAADNAATGGIGGLNNGTLVGGDGTGEARISLSTVDLALRKQARDPAGTVLPDGADVAPGDEIYFVLYVDNPTVASAPDLRITDALDETAFTYVAGSLERTVVPAGSGDAALWSGTWIPLTDALGAPDDGASVIDSGGPPGADRVTVGAVSGQANQPVDLPADSLLAVRFRVRVN